MKSIRWILILLATLLAVEPSVSQPSEDDGEEEVQTQPNPEDPAALAALGVVLPGGGLFQLDPGDPIDPVAIDVALLASTPSFGPLGPIWTDHDVHDPGAAYLLDPDTGTIRFGDGQQGRRPPTGGSTPGVVSVLVLPGKDSNEEGNAVAIETLELAHEGFEWLDVIDCSRDPFRCLTLARRSKSPNGTFVLLYEAAPNEPRLPAREIGHHVFAGVEPSRGAQRGSRMATAALGVTGADSFVLTDESGLVYTGTWRASGKRGRRFVLRLDEDVSARLAAKAGWSSLAKPARGTLRFSRKGRALLTIRVRGTTAGGEPARHRIRLWGDPHR